MRNRDFSKLSNLERVFGTLRNVSMVIMIISSVMLFIGGIVICVYGEIATGISSIISSLILGGFGSFAIYCSHLFATAIIDAMSDIKQTGITIDDMQNKQAEQVSLKLESK